MAARGKRYLIVNADDFGQSLGLNRGIIEAHERGIVTSASLMVRWPAAIEAANYARNHDRLSVGLHFDFSEWACRRGKWERLYQVVDEHDFHAVAREANRQLDLFQNLIGVKPTHLDSHQHAHREKALRPIFVQMASTLGVPLRGCTPKLRYYGGFYGQTTNGRPLPSFIRVRAVIKILGLLPPGFTELSCHPGYADDLNSIYQAERAMEVKTLCDPRVGIALEEMGIELCSFRDFEMPRLPAPQKTLAARLAAA